VPKILIVRVSSLGDVVHNMPVVADIHRRHPDAEVDWLVEASFADLVRIVKGVRRAVPYGGRRWRRAPWSAQNRAEAGALRRELRAQRYDTVIDCQGLIKSAWAARFAGRPVTGLANRTDGAGFEWPTRFFYSRRIAVAARTHVVERSRQLVAAALGDPAPDTSPDAIDFGLDPVAAAAALRATGLALPARYAVFVHATSRADKQWPQENWLALGRILVQRGLTLVLPWGGDAERQVSETLARGFGPAALVPPRLPLAAVVGLVDGAVATVGVDTGLVHIAAALKKPTVELYNFDTAWRTGGYWSPAIVNLGGAAHHPTLADVQRALDGLGVL
jgi:heptosyltransferase-1